VVSVGNIFFRSDVAQRDHPLSRIFVGKEQDPRCRKGPGVVHIHNISFASKLTSGPNKLECSLLTLNLLVPLISSEVN
jgi:hypothetical protein